MGARGSGVGLTTVVFVDVEGSTELLGRDGDEAGLTSVRGQLDVVRARIEAYGGNEVKSLGDGFLLTFSSPRQAVSFALASQRALGRSAPRVRFGINTGEVIDADADPLGSPVNAAARIAGRAIGGEVLVSDVVRQLVGPAPTVRFRDRGRCRLRGFSERWHLYAAEDAGGDHHAAATIGRVAELSAVAALVSSTVAGVGRVLLVEGEAGIGKTHLVREATAQARRGGVGVVEVIADELVRRPGVIAHGLLNAAPAGSRSRRRLDELLNRSATPMAGGEDLSYAVVDASVDLIEAMARSRPVLLAAEDLHWADDLSIGVLAAITRRVDVSRFSVIGSLRPSPRHAALDRLIELVRGGPGVYLRLDSLDEVDVHALASALTGAAPGEALRDRLRATAGNPLFVTELLRCLDDDGVLRVEDGVADVAPGVLPASLHETLVRRLSWLPHETNELLRLASLLGGAFTLRDVAAITGRTVIDVAAGLRAASQAGLIVGDDDRLVFRHDLIREAVYGNMLSAERRDLHCAAGQALARAEAPIQQVAQQFARGALPGDLDAVRWLERAAVETMLVAPSSAVALLDQAVSLAPATWPGRFALQARMIEPLTLCGRDQDAEAIAEIVLAASPDADIEYTALRGLRAVHAARGHTRAELAASHRAAAARGAPVSEARQLRCLAALASIITSPTGAAEARHVAEETLAQGTADHDPITQGVAHETLGLVASVTGYGLVGRDHLSAAVALLDAGSVMPGLSTPPYPFHVLGLLEVDAVDDAREAADRARQRFEQLGGRSRLAGAYLVAGIARLYAGHWDDALAELESGQAVIDDIGLVGWVLYYHSVLARIAIHRGDLTTAEARLTTGIQQFTSGGNSLGADWLFGTQAEFLVATGRPDAALDVAEANWAATAYVRYAWGHRARGILLVRLAVDAGRDELARSVTAELEEGARRSPVASAAGAALWCRGLVEHDPDPVLAAMVRYRETPLRPDLAGCLEDAAGLLAASDRGDRAADLLTEAATIYADIDAVADTTRVDAALRQLGVRRPRRRARRPSSGWESLTPMESEVSRLVAEGLTNPEIGARLYTSRRTVETHLSHVFAKLGLAGRTHLAAELSKRVLLSPPAAETP